MKHTGQRGEHWAQRLFVDHAELFLPFLERALQRGQDEAEALRCLFSEYGIPSAGRVLDLGCGIGRHVIPLAKRGYQVTGLDVSPLYVETARARSEREGVKPSFHVGDMRHPVNTLLGTGPYSAVINMFTTLGFYDRTTDLEMFREARSLATLNAVLVIESISRDWLLRNFQSSAIEEAGDIVIQYQRSFDFETSYSNATWSVYQRIGADLKLRLEEDVCLRAYGLHELKELLEDAGWRYLRAFGASYISQPFQLLPYNLQSGRMWLIAQAS